MVVVGYWQWWWRIVGGNGDGDGFSVIGGYCVRGGRGCIGVCSVNYCACIYL